MLSVEFICDVVQLDSFNIAAKHKYNASSNIQTSALILDNNICNDHIYIQQINNKRHTPAFSIGAR